MFAPNIGDDTQTVVRPPPGWVFLNGPLEQRLGILMLPGFEVNKAQCFERLRICRIDIQHGQIGTGCEVGIRPRFVNPGDSRQGMKVVAFEIVSAHVHVECEVDLSGHIGRVTALYGFFGRFHRELRGKQHIRDAFVKIAVGLWPAGGLRRRALCTGRVRRTTGKHRENCC